MAASRQHVGTRMRVHEAGLAQLAHCSTMLHKAAPCKAQACLLNSAPKATIPLAQDKPALRMKLPIPPRLTRLPLRHQLTRLCWMAACRLPPSINSVTRHSCRSPGVSLSRTNAPCQAWMGGRVDRVSKWLSSHTAQLAGAWVACRRPAQQHPAQE